MDKLIQIQENLLHYFKDVDDTTFIEFVDCFAYESSTENEEVSKLAEKFIDDNGLSEALINNKYDRSDKAGYFKRSSLSQSDMLQNIRTALISISHNRFRQSMFDRKIDEIDKDINAKDKKIKELKSDMNLKSFNLMKNHLLECYACLNDNDDYFFSEDDDAKFVKQITELEYEN